MMDGSMQQSPTYMAGQYGQEQIPAFPMPDDYNFYQQMQGQMGFYGQMPMPDHAQAQSPFVFSGLPINGHQQ